MIDDQLSPDEQNLVQQIRATEKPKLDAAVRDEIRQRVIHEFRAINAPHQQNPPITRPRFSIPLIVGLAAALMIIVLVGLFILQLGNQSSDEIAQFFTATPSPATQVMIAPSATLTVTVEAETSPITPTLSTPTESASITPSTSPSIEPTPPSPTATQEVVVIIEGVVTAIANNTITIYGFDIEVEPQHPILQIIEVGDVVRVQGIFSDSTHIIANVVSNILDTTPDNGTVATVGLEGPIESINGNIIVVNGISIQLAPDSPLLQTVQVGNFVSVQGNFENNGTTIVLVVVNIVIVNNVIIESDCWYHEDGMGMGHWHCDGMGMGMGDDGMGMGRGR
jgi:hypothetical protein